MGSRNVGDVVLYDTLLLANTGPEQITWTKIEFTEVPSGLRIVKIGFQPANQTPVGGPGPLPKSVKEFNGDVPIDQLLIKDNVYQDQNAIRVVVEVQLLLPGAWSVGAGQVTSRFHGVERTQHAIQNMGDLCSKSYDKPCVPGLHHGQP